MNLRQMLGVVAHNEEKTTMFCYDDACFVFGTEELYMEYMEKKSLYADRVVRKVFLQDVLETLKLGGVYLLDAQAYERFKSNSLDDEIGLEVKLIFTPDQFYRLECTPS